MSDPNIMPGAAGSEPAGLAQPSTPAGWYPDPGDPTRQRYWDGTQWTDSTAPAFGNGTVGAPAWNPATTPLPAATATSGDPSVTSEDRTLAMVCHLGLLASFLVPLVIYLIKKDQSPFVRHHAAEALNFALTTFIAAVVAAVLIVVLIGILLLPAVIIAHLVFLILAAIAANRGDWYRYPVNLRLVK